MSQIVCPSCQSTNTRRIQNELAKIENPIFSQGKEWLGYCYDCGCLYNYYEDKIINVPGAREAMKCPDETKKVRKFFAEHPLHAFSVSDIATYLDLSEVQVNRALNTLIVEGFIDARFHLSHPEQLVEEKVKPDCYYRVGVETGACAVCEYFKECPMQGHGRKVAIEDKKSLPKLSRPQCTEDCRFQEDWTCWHDGSITIDNMKCVTFKLRQEADKDVH